VLPPPTTASSTGATFQLLLSLSSHANSERVCQTRGGHLATYTALAEQVGASAAACAAAQEGRSFGGGTR
jgi:hypothetical protein